MGYNGIAYEIKRLGQRGLLVGKSLAKSRHQDVGTSEKSKNRSEI